MNTNMLISILIIVFLWAICGLIAIWLFRQPPEKADSIYSNYMRRYFGMKAITAASPDAEFMIMNVILGSTVILNTIAGILLVIVGFVVFDGFGDGGGNAVIISGAATAALLPPGSALWYIAVKAIKRNQRRLKLEGE